MMSEEHDVKVRYRVLRSKMGDVALQNLKKHFEEVELDSRGTKK